MIYKHTIIYLDFGQRTAGDIGHEYDYTCESRT